MPGIDAASVGVVIYSAVLVSNSRCILTVVALGYGLLLLPYLASSALAHPPQTNNPWHVWFGTAIDRCDHNPLQVVCILLENRGGDGG